MKKKTMNKVEGEKLQIEDLICPKKNKWSIAALGAAVLIVGAGRISSAAVVGQVNSIQGETKSPLTKVVPLPADKMKKNAYVLSHNNYSNYCYSNYGNYGNY